ncbi:hypothetical protein SS50377_27326 [Spironucleus salmonicida]|uniref:Uncharacterized protein n=1 Tax=Spironucleus salmonicida TaxID=348837 RepID=V6LGF1_9EUKA|nr:hypothetical protein SS50377_27326 [Spironucleus salmonicida]|eukprot:EST43373.1 Hypothetical protein SS50377_17053 [Spironucleus salmonicida]
MRSAVLSPTALNMNASYMNRKRNKLSTVDIIVAEMKFTQKEKNYQKAIKELQEQNFNLQESNDELQDQLKQLIPKIKQAVELNQQSKLSGGKLKTAEEIISSQQERINFLGQQLAAQSSENDLQNSRFHAQKVVILPPFPGLQPVVAQLKDLRITLQKDTVDQNKLLALARRLKNFESITLRKLTNYVKAQEHRDALQSREICALQLQLELARKNSGEPLQYVPFRAGQDLVIEDIMTNSCAGAGGG